MTISSKKVVSTNPNPLNGLVTPFPTDLAYRKGYDWLKLTYVIRECHSNAQNYGAKNVLILCVHMDGYDYLLYMHDGKAFDDLNDIVLQGLHCHVSGQAGAAMQGCGLIQGSATMHRYPELYIASFCEDQSFRAGRGYVDRVGLWQKEDATKHIGKKLKALVGEVAAKYKVFYFFRCSLTTKEKRNYISTEMMSQLTLMAPSLMENMTVYIAEKQVGHPAEKDKKYRSYATAVRGGTKRVATNMHRRVCSAQGFLDRFRLEDGRFTLKCAPFDIEISSNLMVRIEKAHLEIDVFPCRYGHPKDSWPMNERAGEDAVGGKFKKGGQNELGKQPPRKAFLSCPWIYHAMAKEVGKKGAERFGRFLDNALGTYNRMPTLMNSLGCRYVNQASTPQPDGSVLKPYVTIRVVIDEIGKITDESQNPPVVEDGHPLQFMQDMERRPDFTFANETAVHKIMQTACEKVGEVAENNAQLKRLKNLCEELFPLGDDEFITLNLEKVDGPSKRRPSPLEPIVLDQDGNFTVVEGTLKVAPGSVVWVTFRYRGTNKFTSDVKLDPLTSRGATLKVLPQEFAEQLPGIEVAQKKVYDEIVKGDADEK